ncbi:MAG: glutamate racemase [Flavobacteriaceae bacterium]|nr:glutamate racemase [Flavobacteriaceae bacterium]
MSTQAIGIFDSGVGGTSIWKEIHELLPNESTIYLADSLHAPYGQKKKERILELSIKNTELLIKKDCKLIVVACNTATTNAISYLRHNYNVPFIGIEPAIKPAALKTKTKAIGILATKGTLSSELFHNTSELFAENIEIHEQVGKGLVELIESGKKDSSEMTDLLKTYCLPILEKNIDYLVLGCTHYPYLIPQLKKILPKTVTIIDSGEAVARQTKAVLERHDLLNLLARSKKKEVRNISHLFYSNKEVNILQDIIGKQFKAEFLKF